MIFNIVKCGTFPTMVEIGFRSVFRLTLEIVVPYRFVRYGLTVKTPLTGTIRHFGFDR